MKEQILDEIVEDYVDGASEMIGKLEGLMKQWSFNCDDMKELADVAYELAQFAEEQASAFEEAWERER